VTHDNTPPRENLFELTQFGGGRAFIPHGATAGLPRWFRGDPVKTMVESSNARAVVLLLLLCGIAASRHLDAVHPPPFLPLLALDHHGAARTFPGSRRTAVATSIRGGAKRSKTVGARVPSSRSKRRRDSGGDGGEDDGPEGVRSGCLKKGLLKVISKSCFLCERKNTLV